METPGTRFTPELTKPGDHFAGFAGQNEAIKGSKTLRKLAPAEVLQAVGEPEKDERPGGGFPGGAFELPSQMQFGQ